MIESHPYAVITAFQGELEQGGGTEGTSILWELDGCDRQVLCAP